MKNEFKKEIIENYLKAKKISKTKFCKLCGISLDTLKKIMMNQRNYRTNALFKIAKVINIQVYQMFRKD